MNESITRDADLYHRLLSIDQLTAEKIVQVQQMEPWERSEADWQLLDVYKAAMSKVMTKLGVTSDLEIVNGEPVIGGTRVPVELILGEIAVGSSAEQILNSYPSLKPGAIDTAIRYAESLPSEHPLVRLLRKYRATCG